MCPNMASQFRKKHLVNFGILTYDPHRLTSMTGQRYCHPWMHKSVLQQ